MSQPLFISLSKSLLPNWSEAFPDADLSVGCPDRIDHFDDALIFLDTLSADKDLISRALERAVRAERRVIVLSPTPNDADAITAIQLGAVGYGHTYSAPSRLREMSLVVNHGGLWVGSNIMKRVMSALQRASVGESVAKKDTVDAFASKLSQRELAVARHVAQGATNLEISRSLDIKERTVKAHITSIFFKLDVRNRVELALLLNNVRAVRSPIENPSKRSAL